MFNLSAMRARRSELQREVRNLLDQNPGASWKANPENQARYDELMAALEVANDEIARYEAFNETIIGERVDSSVEEHARRIVRDSQGDPVAKAFANFLRVGDIANVDDGDRALLEPRMRAYQAGAGFGSIGVSNTMSTGTGSEGGFLVPSLIVPSLFDALKAFGGVRSVATILPTESGGPLNYPNSDGTSEEGEQLDENATAADADTSFGTTPVNTFLYSSKTFAVPLTLMQDSAIDLEAFIYSRLGTRLARITNRKFTVGTGSGEPRGVVTAAGAGKVGATQATPTVTYDDLLDLQHSVDPAYRQLGAAWMLNDSSLKVVRKIKDSNGRPIFVPSYDAGGTAGAPGEILGDPYVINQQMASMAANAKSIIYGHFAPYIIREVMEVATFRFADSAYMRKFQNAFLAFMRCGGNYCDVGGGIKYFQNGPTS